MTIRIYGAGMAGLLTANMMRRHRPMVHEQQARLPDNHGALLRFRTDAVQRETGQPFRRVEVTKAVKTRFGSLYERATINDANRYSYKVTGEVMGRSVMNLDPSTRFIAPDDFLDIMARDVILHVSSPLTLERIREHRDAGDPIISTVPMPVLMDIVAWPGKPTFRWRPVWSVKVKLPMHVNVYQTIYYPHDEAYYRASITGDTLIVEYMQDPQPFGTHIVDVANVMIDFGLGEPTTLIQTDVKRQEYGKLMPVDDRARQTFMLAMTDTYGIYSIGRFATWRQILLDDVVNDVRKVDQWITERNSYRRRLEQL